MYKVLVTGNMVTFALLINSAPHSAQAHAAFRFARAAVGQGYRVIRVFFHGEGVYHALPPSPPGGSEVSLTTRWAELARDANVDLVLCSAAAERRGVWSGESGRAVAEGFRVGGLGQWVEACLQAERTLSFT
ncbi:MAG TPA: sulfurtransferase complex subunit TusD [Methylococcaceae bacterium]|nr:sulfurtransferase complex subunit TusD [Methylococcaceae bacterium]